MSQRSQRNKREQRRKSNLDDDEPSQPTTSQHQSQSQYSQSQRRTQRTLLDRTSQFTLLDLPAELIKKLVNDMVYCLLISDQKKLPIKKGDLVKAVMKDKPRAFPVIIDEAEKMLLNVYGIKLKKLDEAKGYILINTYTLKESKELPVWSKMDTAKQGLLTIILSIIFMNENAIEEKELFAGLKKFGIEIEYPHDTFGDVKKLLQQEFVKQLYLEYNCVSNESLDNKIYEYRWGVRAHLEVKKRDILNFVCKVYKSGMKPQDWPTQLKQIEDEEKDYPDENDVVLPAAEEEEEEEEDEDSD